MFFEIFILSFLVSLGRGLLEYGQEVVEAANHEED